MAVGEEAGARTVRDAADEHVAVWEGELAWLDPVQEAIVVRLAILNRHLGQARRAALRAGDLERWRFKVLLALRKGGPPYEASPSVLADRLGLTRGALSARLRPLEEDGLITRSGEAGDRRRVRVRLTEAGYAVFERHAGEESRGEAALLAALTPSEREDLAGLLRKLVVAADRQAAGEEAADRQAAEAEAADGRAADGQGAAGETGKAVRATEGANNGRGEA
jgi:DNA-binding MarR family transcriptional regulator